MFFMEKPSKDRKLLKIIIAIAVLGFVLYGFSISNGYNIDDDYVCENHQLVKQGIKGIPEIFASRYNNSGGVLFGYRPVTIAIFAIEYQIFGESASIGHFFNIVYYILVCILLFFFLRNLLQTKFASSCYAIATITTVIFMAHAIHTEVVLSLKNREEILCLAFCLSSAILALRFVDKKKIIDIIAAMLLLGIGFLTKESAIVWLAITPLSILFFRSDFILKVPFVKKLKFISDTYDQKHILLIIAAINIIFDAILFALRIKYDIPNYIKQIRYVLFIVFLATYILFLSKRKDISQKSARNFIIWALSLVLVVLHKDIFLLGATVLLVITLFPTEHKSDINWNKAKIIIISAIILLGSGAIIAVAHYLPESLLPKSNAVMAKWQNPIFATDSLSNRYTIGFYGLAFYLKLLFIPYPLRYYYGFQIIPDANFSDPIVIVSIIIHIALVIIAIALFNRRNIASFGILFYLIAIFPFANFFFPFTGVIGERMLFMPSIGFALAIGYLIYNITKGKKVTTYLLVAAIAFPNLAITISRNKDWKDRETLFSHDMEYLHESAKANVIYANLLSDKLFEKANRNNDGTPPAKKYANDIKYIESLYSQALSIDSTYGNAWYNYGYLRQMFFEDYKKSEMMFRKAIECDTSLCNSYYFLGLSLFMNHNYGESIENMQSYISSNTYNAKTYDLAYFFIAQSYAQESQNDSASAYYRLCIDKLTSNNFATVVPEVQKYVSQTNDFGTGILLGQKEVATFPDKDLPYVDLGNYYIQAGDTTNAISNWEIAYEKFHGNKNIAETLYRYFKANGNNTKAEYYKNQISIDN